MIKKKYHGGLKLSLSLLFIMLLIISSTCYARTTLTDSEIEYLVNNFFYFDDVDFTNTYYSDQTYTSFNLNTLQKDDTITFFTQVINNNNTINFNDRLTDFFAINTYWYDNHSRTFHGSIIVGQANFGLNGSLPHLRLLFTTNTNVSNKTYHWWYSFVDDNMTTISQNVQYFDYLYNLNNSTFTFYQRRLLSSPTTEPSAKFVSKFNSTWNLNNNNNNTVDTIAGLVTFYNTQSIYTNFDGSDYYNTPVSKLLKTGYTGNTNDPENPDNPTEPGNTGTITNPSGETTGNIDLSGITSSLNNIENKIPTSGDIQGIISGETGRIIDNQNAIAQQQHDDLTSYDTSIADDGVSDFINDMQTSLSGDLSNSQIFGALEETEQGFLNLITSQASDFEIHWDDVYYNGVKLIPFGQVNFSAICRDNATLGNIKEKLNIILSALCGLALIKYLYNLLLATLGIDNPYLYDNTNEPEVKKSYDVNTGVTTYRGFDKSSKTSWTYRSGGGKK